MSSVDVVVVGAGLFGLTVADRLARGRGLRVAIVDKRDHVGGNAYSSPDEATGIEIHRYGAHLFHTSNEQVWTYVNQFTSFTNYVHRVYAVHHGEVYPLPVNLGTINQFFGATMGPDAARALIASQAGEFAGKEPTNFVEKGISLVGRPLYEAFFMNYTAKQWQTAPEDLPASIVSRLPVCRANSGGLQREWWTHRCLGAGDCRPGSDSRRTLATIQKRTHLLPHRHRSPRHHRTN